MGGLRAEHVGHQAGGRHGPDTATPESRADGGLDGASLVADRCRCLVAVHDGGTAGDDVGITKVVSRWRMEGRQSVA